MRLSWVYAIALGLPLFPVATEEPLRPIVDEARIRQWALELGAERFEVRTAAHEALLAAGEAAWPVLAPYLQDEDLERRHRVESIGRQIAVASGPELVAIKGWLDKLFRRDDDNARAEGMNGLLAGGIAGVAELRRQLRCAKARLRLDIEINRSVAAVGDPIHCQAALRNVGTSPFWLHRANVDCVLPPVSELVRSFGDVRPQAAKPCASEEQAAGLSDEGYPHPIHVWLPFAPGETVSSRGGMVAFDRPGLYRIAAACRHAFTGCAQIRGEGWAQPVSFTIVARAPEIEARSVECRILPDFELYEQDKRLRLNWDAVAPGPHRSGSTLDARLELTSQSGVPLLLEKNLAGYAWYAFLDRKGSPGRWGSWLSACPEPERAELARGRAIARDVPLQLRLNLPLPTEAGTYRLVAYYEIAVDDRGEFPVAPETGGTTTVERVTVSRVWAFQDDVVVTGP